VLDGDVLVLQPGGLLLGLLEQRRQRAGDTGTYPFIQYAGMG
jgi:hypothetical protein